MRPTCVPNFAVAGAARSGTTGVVEGLRSHPNVFVTQPKEPHYFALHSRGARFAGPGDEETINRVAITERDKYLALFPSQLNSYIALGEGSVSTLYYYEDSIPALLDMNPGMRVVIFLRDPVERAYSSHQYMRARGFEPHEDFLTALQEEPRRRSQNWHHIWHYSAMGLYADSIQAFQAAFPPERLGIWFYEDLNRDYVATVRQVLRFLQVPATSGEAVGIPRVNISGAPRFSVVHRGLKWVTGHERFRGAVKRSTSYWLRERVRRSLLNRSPGAPQEARDVLEPLFREDVHRLRLLIQGTVPPWLDN
jgi:hypothetical protein